MDRTKRIDEITQRRKAALACYCCNERPGEISISINGAPNKRAMLCKVCEEATRPTFEEKTEAPRAPEKLKCPHCVGGCVAGTRICKCCVQCNGTGFVL